MVQDLALQGFVQLGLSVNGQFGGGILDTQGSEPTRHESHERSLNNTLRYRIQGRPFSSGSQGDSK